MKVFLDTNILLDVLLGREPFVAEAADLWALCERETVDGFVSAISHNNCHYLLTRLDSKPTADRAVRLLLDTFKTVPLEERLVRKALDAGFTDFEDAIQYYSAIHAKADCFLTRNLKDFPKGAAIPIMTPGEFLRLDQF